MEEYIVYKHTSPNGKVYIGITKQTANNRWKNGLGYESSPHFWNAIQKHGWNNFTHEILASGLTKDEACSEEKRLIAELNATDREFGYNQKLGGELGSSPAKEVREKISQKLKNFYENNPDAKTRISERVKGFRHSEEAKAKMSESKRGRTFTETPEWRQHIGEANKAKILSDQELYESTVKRCRENGLKTAIPVIQFDGDKEIARFSNAHEAERETSIPNGNISRCCRGFAKSAGGYKWQYAS